MGAIAKVFGGSKKKPKPAPIVEAAPKVTQQEPGVTAATAGKRRNARQRSQLISGRPGSPTRSGVSVPGR